MVEDKLVDKIILAVREKLATDHVGDGKIFIRNIEEVVRIRTGERDKVLDNDTIAIYDNMWTELKQ